MNGRDLFNQNFRMDRISGSVRSNRKSFEKTGPHFEVVYFSRSDGSEFRLNGSRPCNYYLETKGPFLEIPSNFSGPKSNIQIEI